MVKIICEPIRLNQFLKQSVAQGKSTISEDALIQFTDDGVVVACQLASDTIVFANYNKSFFNSIEVETPEYFMVTTSLIKDRLSHGFKGEKATLTTDEQYVHVKGDKLDDSVEEKLKEVDEERLARINGKLVHTYLAQIGLMPFTDPSEQEKMPFDLQALIATDRFSDLPEYEFAKFVYDGKTLIMNLEDQMGSRTRLLPIKRFATNNEAVDGTVGQGFGKAITVRFNMKLLQQLVSQFDGDVWMSFNEGMVVLSQANKDYSLSYVVAAA